jgi:hypothetical protein
MEEFGHHRFGYSNAGTLGQKVPQNFSGDLRNVASVLSQRRCKDLKHIDPVIKIGSELSL